MLYRKRKSITKPCQSLQKYIFENTIQSLLSLKTTLSLNLGEHPNCSALAEISPTVCYTQINATDLRKCHIFFPDCFNCRKFLKQLVRLSPYWFQKSSTTNNAVSKGRSISFSISYQYPRFVT